MVYLEHQERLFNSLDLSLGQHQEGLFDCLNHRWDSTKKGVFNCSIHRWDTSSTNSGCLIAWICNSGNKKKGLFDCLSHRWDSTKKGVFNCLDRRWGGVLTARNLRKQRITQVNCLLVLHVKCATSCYIAIGNTAVVGVSN